MIEIMPFIYANPKTSIIIFSLAVTLFTTIVTFFVVDKNKMKEIKEKQKWIKEEMKRYRDNADKMMELNKQMMENLPDQIKQSFKPMLITIIPLLIFFAWLRGIFAGTAIASTWIFWYIGASILFSMALRKIFKLE